MFSQKPPDPSIPLTNDTSHALELTDKSENTVPISNSRINPRNFYKLDNTSDLLDIDGVIPAISGDRQKPLIVLSVTTA